MFAIYIESVLKFRHSIRSALIFLLVFTLYIENVLTFKLTVIKGLSLQNLVICLLMCVWAFSVLKGNKLFQRNNVNGSIFLLILTVLASIPVKMNLGEVPVDMAQEMVNAKNWANPLLIFFILFNSMDDEKTCNHALVAVGSLLFLSVASVHLSSFGIFKIGGIVIQRGGEEGRASGFGEPNQYAAYLVLFIPLLFSRLLFEKGYLRKGFMAFFCLITMLAMVFTGSRGGAVSLICCILVYIFALRRKKLAKPGAVILIPLLVVLMGGAFFIVAPSRVRDKIIDRFDVEKKKDAKDLTAGRSMVLANGIAMFLESPIFGHGQATFIPLDRMKFHTATNSHNDYLTQLVEYGLIGLAVFCMGLWKVFLNALRQLNTTGNAWLAYLYAAYLAGFCGYCVQMLSVNVILPRYPFWIYTAIIYKYAQLEASAEASTRAETAGCPVPEPCGASLRPSA
jgi:oligosaccharide repeat unit polymerase